MKFRILLFLIALTKILICQKEYSQWYFGNKAGIDFLASPPGPLTNGAMNTMEGTACISDSLGNLLFYTNGESIWNKNHMIMANGTGLTGHVSTTQSALIVKKPGSQHLFYVFTQGSADIPSPV